MVSGGTSINSGSGALWSVRVASAANGPETEVLRTPARNLAATSVAPPVPGTWFFRGCVENTGPLTATIEIHISPI